MFNRVLGGEELEQEIDKGVRGSHCKEAVLHTDGHHLLRLHQHAEYLLQILQHRSI